MDDVRVVGKKEESLAVHIKAARSPYGGWERIEVGEGFPCSFPRELGEHPVRLEQQNVGELGAGHERNLPTPAVKYNA
jgi:hypothetical protein